MIIDQAYVVKDAERLAKIPAHHDITLSSGTVIAHKRLLNGSQEANPSHGGAMTPEEWDEYCLARIEERKLQKAKP